MTNSTPPQPATVSDLPTHGAFRTVPFMRAMSVIDEATKLGFRRGDPDWCNLGQGQPEVGEMEGAPPRILSVKIEPNDCGYGPVAGLPELRQTVADHYNRLYRHGKTSQYSSKNVAIAGGGRVALGRLLGAVGSTKFGCHTPNYMAYEDMLDLHRIRLNAVRIADEHDRFGAVTGEQLQREQAKHQLDAYLFSNPANPVGTIVQGNELRAYASLARQTGMTLISDEYYSNYVYRPGGPNGDYRPGAGAVSIAPHLDDVNEDPVVIVDGLGKNFRYPGWRLAWIVGPEPIVDMAVRMGSSLDGGPSMFAQRAAMKVLEKDTASKESAAIRNQFTIKRNVMVQRLKEMGIQVPVEPEGTFYCWGDLSGFKPPYNDGVAFFRQALRHKTITTPGEYFDIRPTNASEEPPQYRSWVRFSFGPPIDNMNIGLSRLAKMLPSAGNVDKAAGRV